MFLAKPERLLDNIKKLITSITSSDNKVDTLENDWQDLTATIKCSKEFSQELAILTNLSVSQPRASLYAALHDELDQVAVLREENSHLRTAIGHHEAVLEMIMDKFREQHNRLIRLRALEQIYPSPNEELKAARYAYLKQAIHEMASVVMPEACAVDEKKLETQDALLRQLKDANIRMKKRLFEMQYQNISEESNNQQLSILAQECNDND